MTVGWKKLLNMLSEMQTGLDLLQIVTHPWTSLGTHCFTLKTEPCDCYHLNTSPYLPCLHLINKCILPLLQTVIQMDPEELVVNTALLQLAGYTPPVQPYHPPSIQALPDHDKQAYDCIVKCMEHLAAYLKYCGNSEYKTLLLN